MSLALPLFPFSPVFKPLLLSPAATSSTNDSRPTRSLASVSTLSHLLPHNDALPALISYGDKLLAAELPYDAITTIASVLSDLCAANDIRDCPVISKFHAASKPDIAVKDYLLRVYQYAECSETCFILALAYINRIQHHPDLIINSLNIHRLLITSVMVAAKFFDDHYYNNAFYARIGGVTKEEMNQLELEFLFMISFSLSLTVEEFSYYDFNLRSHHFATVTGMRLPSATITPVEQYRSQSPDSFASLSPSSCASSASIEESSTDINMSDSSQAIPLANDLTPSFVADFAAALSAWPIATPVTAPFAAAPSSTPVALSMYAEWEAMQQSANSLSNSVAQPTSFVVANSSFNSQSQQSQATMLVPTVPSGAVHRRDSPIGSACQPDQLSKRARAESAPVARHQPVVVHSAHHVPMTVASHNPNFVPKHQLHQLHVGGFPFPIAVGSTGVKLSAWQHSINQFMFSPNTFAH